MKGFNVPRKLVLTIVDAQLGKRAGAQGPAAERGAVTLRSTERGRPRARRGGSNCRGDDAEDTSAG